MNPLGSIAYTSREIEVLDDPATGDWLQDAIHCIRRREVVGYLNELAILQRLLDARFQGLARLLADLAR
jgi:hypothetical protein